MNDLIRLHLERLQQQLGAVAAEFGRMHSVRFGGRACWGPPVNAWRCGGRFVICVDLAGIDKSAFAIRAEPRRLLISGNRTPPEPPCDEEVPAQLLVMEIDHGPFERVLELPVDVVPERVTAEYREGLLWITLPLRSDG